MKYEIQIIGKSALCPHCGGGMKHYITNTSSCFRCVDCNAKFKRIADGLNDRTCVIKDLITAM